MWDLQGVLAPTASVNLSALRRRLELSCTSDSFRVAVESLLRSAPEHWCLYHPVLNYLHILGVGVDGTMSTRDLQLVFWLGSHSWADSAIELDVVNDTIVWSCCGSQLLRRGRYSVSHFRHEITTPRIDWDIAGLCTAGPYPDMWPSGDEELRILRMSLANTLAVLDDFQSGFPHIFDWAARATRTIVPLMPRPDGRIRSRSLKEEIGTVFIDLSRPVCFLESLVHESAHQHFYLYEQSSALVLADGGPELYSPLKKSLRPLRGVFLAYHALACIAQLYSELMRARAFSEASLAQSIESVRSDLEIAAISMRSSEAYLSEAGLTLFERLENRRMLLSL